MTLWDVFETCAPAWEARPGVYDRDAYRLAVDRYERFLRRTASAADVTPEQLADFRRWSRRELVDSPRGVLVYCCCLERLAAESRDEAGKLLVVFAERHGLIDVTARRALLDFEVWAQRSVLLTDLHANFLQAWKHERAPYWRVVIGIANINAIIGIWERAKAAKLCRYHAPARLKVEPGLARVPSIYRRRRKWAQTGEANHADH